MWSEGAHCNATGMWSTHLGAIGELVGRKIDPSKAALADQPP